MGRSKDLQKNERIIAIKEKAINHLLIVVAIYSIASSYYIVFRLLQNAANPLLYIRFSLNILILALFFIRKYINLNLKVLLIVFINIIIYASGLKYLGFLAPDNILLAIIPIFLSFVVKLRYALLGLAAFLLVYFVFAFLYSTTVIEDFILATESIRNFFFWIMISVAFSSISLGSMLIIHNYSKSIIAYEDELEKQNFELTESENKYRTFFESSNDAIVLLKDGKFYDYNKKTLELFQCDGDYFKGRFPYEFSPERQLDGKSSKDKSEELIAKLKIDEVLLFDWQYIRPNGELFEVSVSFSVKKLKNELFGLSILRDVTEKRRLERELKQHKNNLEKLVAEKTKDYEDVNEDLKAANEELHSTNEELNATNEELYLKNEMLKKRKNELKEALYKLKEAQVQLVQSEKMASLGVLTAGVAHEINNPLNFIQAGVYALENVFNSDKDLKNILTSSTGIIQNIQFGVERASAIVKSLNTFSRKDNNQLKECNIHKIIENALLILNHKIKNKSEVIKEFTIEDSPVMANEEGLHQVFLNILNNAIQAIETNNGIIKIQTAKKDGYFEIRITDNGTGIPEELKERIFDPFFTTKDPGDGVGLGLSIVYKILEEHKGEISFLSDENNGTTAYVKLPITNKVS